MTAYRWIVLLVVLISATVNARTITITTGEYPPWTGTALPNDGYVNHLVSEAFAAVGVTVKFVYMPWKRAFEEAKRGNYHATTYWFENRERRDAMLFSDPLIQNRTVFFQRSEDQPIEWKTLEDLADYRMSATVGFTYTEEFHKAMADGRLQVTQVPADLQNIKMLMSKRVDLVATDEMSGFYMAAALSIDPRKLRVLEPALSSTSGFLMASKTDPQSEELIATFNRGLQLIKANGQYRKILNRVDNSSFYNPATPE